MNVPAEIRLQVTNKLAECVKIIEGRYGVKMPIPVVQYNLRGRTAGKAYFRQYLIRLNTQLLIENTAAFLSRTVPHEFAHLVTDKIYPEAHQRSWGQKRNPHGEQWQSVMRTLGAPSSRCHQYDTTNSKVRRSNVHTLVCINCKKEYGAKWKTVAKLKMNPEIVRCRCTRGANLVLKTADRLPLAAERPTNPAASVPAPSYGESKIDVCRRLFTANRNISRGEMIDLFISKAGCTKAGASTYYYTLKGK